MCLMHPLVPVTCTVPGCGEPVELSWQRRATAAEALTFREHVRARIAELAESRRLSVRLSLLQLEQTLAALPDDMPDREALQDRLTAAIRDLNAELAGITVEPLDMDPDATVAVHGCTDHAIDLETAALLHPESCHSDGPCACEPSTSGG